MASIVTLSSSPFIEWEERLRVFQYNNLFALILKHPGGNIHFGGPIWGDLILDWLYVPFQDSERILASFFSRLTTIYCTSFKYYPFKILKDVITQTSPSLKILVLASLVPWRPVLGRALKASFWVLCRRCWETWETQHLWEESDGRQLCYNHQ